MPRKRDRLAEGFAAATLAVGVLAIGGAPRWAALSTAALALAGASCFLAARRSAVSALIPFLVATAALTALQWVPLPASVIEVLSPRKYTLISDNARALSEGLPRLFPISYDPPATLLELIKLISYAAFGLVCVQLATRERQRRRIVLASVAAACTLAGLAVIHELGHFDSVYGLYPLDQLPQVLLGPVVNPNHLAAVLALAAPVTIGLAIEARGNRRLLWAGATFLLAAGTMLTRSRGGFLGLAVGLLAGALLWALQYRKQRPQASKRISTSSAIAAGVVGVCAMVLIGAATAGGLLHDLGATKSGELTGTEGKAEIWQKSAPLADQFRYAGVGRGAFGFAFTRLQPDSRVTRTHVENEYLQAVIDWGVPGAGLVAALLVLLALPILRRWSAGPVEAGIIAGFFGLAAHSVFDFALQVPGVALPAIGLLAVMVPAKLERKVANRTKLIAVRGAVLAASLVFLVAAATSPGKQARSESVALNATSSPNLSGALEAWHRHPADYVLAGITAQQMLLARDQRSIAVLNRALYLDPKHPALHALAARALYAFGKRDQALVEMSLALADAIQRRSLVDTLVGMYSDPAEAARGVPTDDVNAALGIIDMLRRRRHPRVAESRGAPPRRSPQRARAADCSLAPRIGTGRRAKRPCRGKARAGAPGGWDQSGAAGSRHRRRRGPDHRHRYARPGPVRASNLRPGRRGRRVRCAGPNPHPQGRSRRCARQSPPAPVPGHNPPGTGADPPPNRPTGGAQGQSAPGGNRAQPCEITRQRSKQCPLTRLAA